MKLKITKTNKILSDSSIIYLIDKKSDLSNYSFTKNELEYIQKQLDDDKKRITINSYSNWNFIQVIEEKESVNHVKEELRKAGNKIFGLLKENKLEEITIVDVIQNNEFCLSFLEGITLSNYQFLKYFKDADEKKSSLKNIKVFGSVSQEQLKEIEILTKAVGISKDLINEPLSYLTAPQLAEDIIQLGNEAGFKVETFNKKKIETLKMGGLLAVNKGSIDPPTFSILEWKPQNAINKKPVILVGKGIVYDTGGLSLKPTNYMDTMKSDMSGAAAVVGAFYAVSMAKLPVHLIGLIPATDNRLDGNAYTPGDVIKMHNDLTVEVLNTDAEGRMILADALSYAKKYDPELVIDLATLTGSASIAIGTQGIVAMGTANEDTFKNLKESGFNVHERIVEFPFWDEYKEMIKSDIADIKNIGGRDAGAITAGKFLEHFTDYPWIHMDIAGPAFLTKQDSYRGKGGAGIGVRLLFDFLKNRKGK